MTYWIFAAAYILGAIPFGLILVRLAGKGDIRDVGSGNIGTTNVLRTGSKLLAIATLLADAGKGALVILLARHYGLSDLDVALAGFIVVAAHIFPVWLMFKGGKGVATALGVYIAINPILGLMVLATWILVAKLFRISSLSALIALFMAPIYTVIVTVPIESTILCIALYVLICWTHRDNIRRILKGEESFIV
ncbi:MAG: glycerol-3-phosphate 1-O-acyltransferase PlsY [Candidatus Paracaedibacteraceae bacterium]|nr:glycerol-3-phosphate 1-O-acyltransferase PlsY [Candidatus Paracaedibacteraceae bacterium]